MCERKIRFLMRRSYLSLRQAFLLILTIFYKRISFEEAKIRKILVIRIDRIGDVVLSLPTIRALKKHFPQRHIAVIVTSANRDLLVGNSNIDEIIVYDEGGRDKGFLSKIRFIKELRKRRFDLAIDLLMDYPLKSALLTFLSGAQYRLGYDIEGRGVFFNIRVKPDEKEKHMIERNLDVVRTIGVDTVDKDPELAISEEETKYIAEFLNRQNVSREDLLVGIHPGGHYPSQRWLPERFAQLADEIIIRFDAKVIVIGGLDERALVHKVAGSMKKKAIEAAGFELNKLTALIARCNLFICNNFGPLHIAAALKTPTVSTMGPTVANLWWPWGENHIVIRKNLSCISCNLGVCKTHLCMELITVEDVLEVVEKQLERIRKNK